jgi:hypothetical protein
MDLDRFTCRRPQDSQAERVQLADEAFYFVIYEPGNEATSSNAEIRFTNEP